jgi:cellobiose phosphorylase
MLLARGMRRADGPPASRPAGPHRLESDAGLRVELNRNGSLRRIDHGPVCVNLFLGSELEGGPANLWLRRRGAGRIDAIPLLGPRSPAAFAFDARGLCATGRWGALRFALRLVLADSAPAWFWHVAIENAGEGSEVVDLVHAQDLALADYAAVRLNEYYVSQYVDYTPLDHPERGTVLAVRQNLAMGGRHPWLALGALGRAAGFATDALQLHGLASRAGEEPAALAAEALPGRRLQHEHSMAVLQEEPLRLAPGEAAARGFFAWLEPDHPDASSAADLARVERALALPEAASPAGAAPAAAAEPAAATLFSHAPRLACRELAESELADVAGGPPREVERESGRALSLFAGERRHVALRAKELAVLRPHGQILRTGARLAPDEASLTTTVWMAGTFHSMLTQGHVSINRFLSTVHGYLGLFHAHGLRVFAEVDGAWQLLDVPSAFAMEPSAARWVYAHAGGRLEVRSWAALDRHEVGLALDVAEGGPRRFLVSAHVALAGDDGAGAGAPAVERDARGVRVRVPPDTELGRRFPDGAFRIEPGPETVLERVGGDELLFADGATREQPYVVVVTAPLRSVAFRIRGELVAAPRARRGSRPGARSAARPEPVADAANAERFWRRMTGPLVLRAGGAGAFRDVARLGEILPWLAHDAWIHWLAPRGLEQYSGGGWGTRDVCQGPVELLLALGRHAPVRDLLLRVFRQQNPDGDWPQWFMFFEREREIRPADSHGDVVFWPLHALAQYVTASDDARILDARVPFFAPGGVRAERATVWQHVERALGLIGRRVIPGTGLAAYGHGDWNDSLQPVDPAMRERLCSAWTVTLQHQTLRALAAALRRADRPAEAERLEEVARGVAAEFQRLLFEDGVLAGFSYFHADGRIERLLHPSDRATGLRYRLLPMIHALLAELLTPQQARAHVALIRAHLLGPDGARLFDRPPRYRGGPQRHFQRAESATFFGREIGLMYVHAHLRYAEAMAHFGDADAFFLALRQANPVGVQDAVPPARPRQANCYASSSDACFADRSEAEARYGDLLAGRVPLEGGWRVYSSGAGIALRLVRERLLGLRLGRTRLGVDPVLPRALDGLRARVALAGRTLDVEYRVGPRGHGPVALALNGRALPFARVPNAYREGGVEVAQGDLRAGLAPRGNRLVVELG